MQGSDKECYPCESEWVPMFLSKRSLWRAVLKIVGYVFVAYHVLVFIEAYWIAFAGTIPIGRSVRGLGSFAIVVLFIVLSVALLRSPVSACRDAIAERNGRGRRIAFPVPQDIQIRAARG